MPEKKTLSRSRKAKREGKAPSTQAGPFVEEEIHHLREGKHGARSTKQAIAIGLSKARRSGVKLPARGRRARARPVRSGSARPQNRPSARRSRAILGVLRREPRRAGSHRALSRFARDNARRKKARRSATGGLRNKRAAARQASPRKPARYD